MQRAQKYRSINQESKVQRIKIWSLALLLLKSVGIIFSFSFEKYCY